MVQTSAGTKNSDWIQFIRECSALYHARKAAEVSEKAEEEGEKRTKQRKVKETREERPPETSQPSCLESGGES